MQTHYVTVFSEESYSTIINTEKSLKESGAIVLQSGVALDSSGLYHIIMEIECSDEVDFSSIISSIDLFDDVVEVRNMENSQKEIRFIFNVNCNCKKTLKKISKKPERIVFFY